MRKLLTIPFHRQHTSYTCGPAVLAMVFDFFHTQVSEKTLVKELKTTKKQGTSHAHLIRAAQKHGFYCFVHHCANINHMREFLEQGLPVIIHYIEPTDNEGHYAIVIGMDRTRLVLSDPWNGKQFTLTTPTFTQRWHGADHTKGHWLMVLSQEPFDVGRQYVPLTKTQPSKKKRYQNTKAKTQFMRVFI